MAADKPEVSRSPIICQRRNANDVFAESPGSVYWSLTSANTGNTRYPLTNQRLVVLANSNFVECIEDYRIGYFAFAWSGHQWSCQIHRIPASCAWRVMNCPDDINHITENNCHCCITLLFMFRIKDVQVCAFFCVSKKKNTTMFLLSVCLLACWAIGATQSPALLECLGIESSYAGTLDKPLRYRPYVISDSSASSNVSGVGNSEPDILLFAVVPHYQMYQRPVWRPPSWTSVSRQVAPDVDIGMWSAARWSKGSSKNVLKTLYWRR